MENIDPRRIEHLFQNINHITRALNSIAKSLENLLVFMERTDQSLRTLRFAVMFLMTGRDKEVAESLCRKYGLQLFDE